MIGFSIVAQSLAMDQANDVDEKPRSGCRATSYSWVTGAMRPATVSFSTMISTQVGNVAQKSSR